MGQLAFLPNFTNSAKLFHVINDFNFKFQIYIQINYISKFTTAQVIAHEVHIET